MDLRVNCAPPKNGTVVLWGLLASSPFGGMIWQVLHYLIGLRQLGFDVWYVEDSDKLVYDLTTYDLTSDFKSNVAALSRFMKMVGMEDRWVFRPPERFDDCLGARDFTGLKALYTEADAVINLCGAQELMAHHEQIRCLIYLQTDPVSDQVKVAQGSEDKIKEFDAYDFLFSYGANIGHSDCRIPLERYHWHPTRPPVFVDWWNTSDALPSDAALTTIANWKHAVKDVVWRGETWRWSKHSEFEKVIDLPRRSSLPLEIAVGAITVKDRDRLRKYGWRTRPSGKLADPGVYRDYIQNSLGEFTVAKEQYVRPRSGWFSDRSVCYLASGRPVITQDTGLDRLLPTGKGLHVFTTADEAIAAIEDVAQDYLANVNATRDLVHEYFRADKVLREVMQTVGLQ